MFFLIKERLLGRQRRDKGTGSIHKRNTDDMLSHGPTYTHTELTRTSWKYSTLNVPSRRSMQNAERMQAK